MIGPVAALVAAAEGADRLPGMAGCARPLAARGRLFDLESAVDAEEDDDEDVSEESVDELLAADFGEDLVASDDAVEDDGETPDLPATPVAANDSNADRTQG